MRFHRNWRVNHQGARTRGAPELPIKFVRVGLSSYLAQRKGAVEQGRSRLDFHPESGFPPRSFPETGQSFTKFPFHPENPDALGGIPAPWHLGRAGRHPNGCKTLCCPRRRRDAIHAGGMDVADVGDDPRAEKRPAIIRGKGNRWFSGLRQTRRVRHRIAGSLKGVRFNTRSTSPPLRTGGARRNGPIPSPRIRTPVPSSPSRWRSWSTISRTTPGFSA